MLFIRCVYMREPLMLNNIYPGWRRVTSSIQRVILSDLSVLCIQIKTVSTIFVPFCKAVKSAYTHWVRASWCEGTTSCIQKEGQPKWKTLHEEGLTQNNAGQVTLCNRFKPMYVSLGLLAEYMIDISCLVLILVKYRHSSPVHNYPCLIPY